MLRIGRLSSLLGLNLDALLAFKRQFTCESLEFVEASTALRHGDAGMMVRSYGEDFAVRCASYMHERGVSARFVSRFITFGQSLRFRYIFFKAEFDAEGATECSYYFRHRIPLESVRAWFADGAASDEDWSKVVEVAAALGQTTCLFGAGSSAQHQCEKAYFFIPPRLESLARLDAAIKVLRGCKSAWKRLHPLREAVSKRMTALSLTFENGRLMPYAKVDFHDVAPELLVRLVADHRDPEDTTELLKELMELTGQDRLQYVAFRLTHTADLSAKAYVELAGSVIQ